MKRIFEYIGGIPIRLRFDNMTTAVAQVLKDGERLYPIYAPLHFPG
jgi:transposase